MGGQGREGRREAGGGGGLERERYSPVTGCLGN